MPGRAPRGWRCAEAHPMHTLVSSISRKIARRPGRTDRSHPGCPTPLRSTRSSGQRFPLSPNGCSGPLSSPHVLTRQGMENTSLKRVVGIDVAQSFLDVYDSGCRGSRRVAYDTAGLRGLIAELSGERPDLVVCEATGGLERRVAAELVAVGIAVAVVNPRQVRDYAKAIGRLAKTD